LNVEPLPIGDRPPMPRWRQWVLRGLMALCAAAVLYCWAWVVTTWVGFGFYRTIWRWIGGEVAGLGLLVGLAAWQARATLTTSGGGIRYGVLAVIWTLAALLAWYVVVSPFSRDDAVASVYVTSTWWLFWAWLMFFVAWRWRARLGVLTLLIAVAAVYLAAVQADGLDGDGRPRLVWRLRTRENPRDTSSDRAVATDIMEAEQTESKGDYPRFRGLDCLATARGVNLARDWSRNQPVLRWRHGVGVGWSSLVAAGSQVFTQEQRAERESVVCYDRATGRELWVHGDEAHYQFPNTGDGPRATPTVDGESVFALGATGFLNCLDRSSGVARWTVNIVEDNAAQAPGHGMCGSPLIVDDLVVVSAGGPKDASLVAYDKSSGKRRWRAGNDPAGYASPQLIELAGTRQIVIVNTTEIVSHDPSGGQILWSFPWKNDTQTNCSQPCPVGTDRLFISSDYGKGCALLELSRDDAGRWHVEPLWTSRAMQTKFASPVAYGQHAYGLDDGILSCVSLADGRRLWKRGRYGHGQLLLADDILVVLAEDGRVALVEATPDEHRELATMQALDGKTWNHPALAGRQLFIRNDHEAACYELPLQDSASP
jgi:outer membrane protein assembly factor BamB